MISSIMKRRLLAGAALCVLPLPALAQTPPEPPIDNSGEIVVTATRDRTAASKTPISMKVYGPEEILQKNIHDTASLVSNDSSISFNQGGGEPYVAMRGVQSTDTTEIGDPAVPVSVDNFFSNRSYSLNVGFLDLDRIEVLRGPQGTLFGRNAVGGLVTAYTADPTPELGGFVQYSGGDYNANNTTGALNIPLTDTLLARVSFATNYHSGYRDLGVLGKGDDQNNQAARVKLLWKPIDNLKLVASYQHSNVDDTGSTHYTINGQYLAAAPVVDLYGHPVLSGGSPTFNNPINTNVVFTGNAENLAAGVGIAPIEQIQEDTLLWRAEYGAPDSLSFNYLGGYDTARWRHESATGAAGVNSSFEGIEHPRTLNQEVRVASSQDEALRWQVGGFYFQEHNSTSANTLLDYGTPQQYNPLYFRLPNVHSESIAGYGQATYAVTDEFKLTAGGRYTQDSKESDQGGLFCAFFFGGSFTNPACVPNGGKLNPTGTWTYHFGADYQASSKTLFYVKADKGYKAGGFNNGVPYKPELNYAYEAGVKTKLFDNKVTFNAAGFYSLYKDFQVLVSEQPSSGLTSSVINAGRANIFGLEAGVVANGGSLGKVDFNETALHARFVDFTTDNDRFQVINGVIPPNISYKGKQLPNAPDLTFTIGYQNSFPLFGGTITPRIEGKYTSDLYFLPANTRDSLVEANFIANAYLTYDSSDGRYTIEAFVRNLGNAAVISDFTTSFFGQIAPSPPYAFNAGYATAYGFAPPRTYGARIRYNF